MVELNHRDRTIKIKIVYYGPPLGGKTTNLQVLHQHALASRRGEMVSINSAQDRTILFDLLPLKAAGFRGFDLRVQLLAVPGQAMYAATRRLVLKGADALVFVANSATDRWEENIQSFREMTQNLLAHQLDPASLPLVLQYNKRDLPHVTSVEFMDRTLNARRIDVIQAVAVRGEGVLETFTAVLHRAMNDLATRYRIVETGRGQTLQEWTRQTVLGMFGTSALALEPHSLPMEPPAPPPPPPGGVSEAWYPPERRTLKVAQPEEATRIASKGPDARANETLVESYAQASAQLGSALEQVQEQRDVARRRLDDVQHALATAHDFLTGQPLETTLRGILGRMTEATGSSHATFLLPDATRSVRAAALRGVAEDPLLRAPVGVRHVTGKLLGINEPLLQRVADNLDLGDALESSEPAFAAVLSAPVRTPRGLQGLIMLYYTPDAALPGNETLAHLALISRTLSAPLELARALETVRNAERTLQLALAGTASVRGLEQVVAFLEELRDRQGEMRRRADAPDWFLEEFARLSPSLSGALGAARSLLSFSRGEVRREAVDMEELVAELMADGVSAALGPGASTVSGDAVLLRLALRALVEQARLGRTPEAEVGGLEIRSRAEAGRVRISVGDKEGTPPASAFEAPRSTLRSNEESLALVRRIAELHGGSLTLESEGKAATRYTLTLLRA
jgi:signal recognition particle receptor subunit beta/GAF domain-containing protein